MECTEITVLDILDELKRKKKTLETDIGGLNEIADTLYNKAESTGKITCVTQANSLRHTTKDKKSRVS